MELSQWIPTYAYQTHWLEGEAAHAPKLALMAHYFFSNQLELRNEDGSLMAYICSTLPYHLRCSLMRDLVLCFGDINILTDKDTSQSEEGDFQAMHFSWYNRHATTVRIHNLIIIPILKQG